MTQAQTPSTRTDAAPYVQGEGNYSASRRHRKSAEEFLESGKVEQAAEDAAPETPAEAEELRKAEDAGRAPARK